MKNVGSARFFLPLDWAQAQEMPEDEYDQPNDWKRNEPGNTSRRSSSFRAELVVVVDERSFENNFANISTPIDTRSFSLIRLVLVLLMCLSLSLNLSPTVSLSLSLSFLAPSRDEV